MTASVMTGLAQVKAGLKALLPNSGGRVEALMSAWEQDQTRDLHIAKTALIEERAGLLKKMNVAHDAYRPKHAAAEADVKKAQADLAVAVAKLHQTEADYRNVSFPLERRRDAIESELGHIAAAKIRVFEDAIRADLVATMHRQDSMVGHSRMGTLVEKWSNHTEVNARIQALESLRWTIRDEWYLQPWTPEEMDARFAEALAALPSVPVRPSEAGADAA